MSHFVGNKLFSSKQFGFIRGRSTCMQLLNVLDPAFPLRKFFKESLTHGPLNLCVNEKTVRVNESGVTQGHRN